MLRERVFGSREIFYTCNRGKNNLRERLSRAAKQTFCNGSLRFLSPATLQLLLVALFGCETLWRRARLGSGGAPIVLVFVVGGVVFVGQRLGRGGRTSMSGAQKGCGRGAKFVVIANVFDVYFFVFVGTNVMIVELRGKPEALLTVRATKRPFLEMFLIHVLQQRRGRYPFRAFAVGDRTLVLVSAVEVML